MLPGPCVAPFLRTGQMGLAKVLFGDASMDRLSEQRSSDNHRAKLVRVFRRQRNEGDEAGMLQTLKNHAEKCGYHLRYFQTNVWPGYPCRLTLPRKHTSSTFRAPHKERGPDEEHHKKSTISTTR